MPVFGGGLVYAGLIIGFIVVFILPYLVGSIPTGLLLARLSGYGDIRTIGSGNIGATNVLRTGNKKLAALTLFLDMIKGIIPTAFIVMLWHAAYSDAPHFGAPFRPYLEHRGGLPVACMAGGMAILGHIFPVWLKFKGGKGVATAIGTLLAIQPLLAACVIVFWLGTFFISRISSLSALSAFAGATLAAAFLGAPFFLYMLVVTLLIFATHRSNIARLLKGREHTWSKSNEPS